MAARAASGGLHKYFGASKEGPAGTPKWTPGVFPAAPPKPKNPVGRPPKVKPPATAGGSNTAMPPLSQSQPLVDYDGSDDDGVAPAPMVTGTAMVPEEVCELLFLFLSN